MVFIRVTYCWLIYKVLSEALSVYRYVQKPDHRTLCYKDMLRKLNAADSEALSTKRLDRPPRQ